MDRQNGMLMLSSRRIKAVLGFRQFSLRGLDKVRGE
jgi:hypothetical protein